MIFIKIFLDQISNWGNEMNFLEIYILFFGMCIGSFLNVCIYRIPASKSIVHPGSSCPECENKIRIYDNIPVLSYILLRGKCRHCKTPISFRYVLVELLTGLLALAIFMSFGMSSRGIIEGLVYFAFISALIVIIFIDIDLKIIPNVITLPGIPIFFAASFILSDITFMDSLIGILSGGGSLFLVGQTYTLITGKEGMGMGDVKLLAMIGAIIGWKGVLFTIFIGSATGTLVGIPLMITQKENMKLAIPFGPFLSIGAITYIFFGDIIIQWYFNFL